MNITAEKLLSASGKAGTGRLTKPVAPGRGKGYDIPNEVCMGGQGPWS